MIDDFHPVVTPGNKVDSFTGPGNSGMEGKVIVLRQVRFGKIIRQHPTGLQISPVQRQRADNAAGQTMTHLPIRK
jgi:hypothetical protein